MKRLKSVGPEYRQNLLVTQTRNLRPKPQFYKPVKWVYAHPFDVWTLQKPWQEEQGQHHGFFDELKVNGLPFFLTVSGLTRKKPSDSKPFLECQFCCTADSRDQKKILNYRLTHAGAPDSPRSVCAIMITCHKPLKLNVK